MKRHKFIARLAADVCMILSIAFAPLWFVAVFALALAWIFAPYYEVILWGLSLDAVYGFHSEYGIALSFITFAMIELLKKKTRV
jgi:hypothetical protein